VNDVNYSCSLASTVFAVRKALWVYVVCVWRSCRRSGIVASSPFGGFGSDADAPELENRCVMDQAIAASVVNGLLKISTST
jgi:hypothetical protein